MSNNVPAMDCQDVEHEVCQLCTMEQRENCTQVEEPHMVETMETVCEKVPSKTCERVMTTVYEEVPRQSCVDSVVPVCEETPVRKCEMKPQPQEHVTLTQEC